MWEYIVRDVPAAATAAQWESKLAVASSRAWRLVALVSTATGFRAVLERKRGAFVQEAAESDPFA